MEIDYIEEKINAYLNGYEFNYELDPLPEEAVEGIDKIVNSLNSDINLRIKEQISEDEKPLEGFPKFLQGGIQKDRELSFSDRVKKKFAFHTLCRIKRMSPWDIYFKSYDRKVKEITYDYLHSIYPFLEKDPELEKLIDLENNGFDNIVKPQSVIFLANENSICITAEIKDGNGMIYIKPPYREFNSKLLAKNIMAHFPERYAIYFKGYDISVEVVCRYDKKIDEEEIIIPAILSIIAVEKEIDLGGSVFASRFNVLGDMKYTPIERRTLNEFKTLNQDRIFIYGSKKFYEEEILDEYDFDYWFVSDLKEIIELYMLSHY